jgi:glycosyltransferase involved in cell wall biosynthesis
VIERSSDRTRVIALVTDAIAPYHRGGKEQRYQALAPRLARDAEVHVYTMNWWRGPRVRRDGDVVYHAIAPLVPLYAGERRSIREALVFAVCCLRLLFARFDVIEADHMPYVQLLPLKLVSLMRRRRLVVTWHECWGRAYWDEYLGPLGRIGWLCEMLSTRLPDAIIAASPQTAERLRELAGDRPIIVAPNGVDRAAIDAAAPAEDGSDIVVVGRLLSHKRVDLLLDAVARLRERGLELAVEVVGSGPEGKALRAQRDRLRLGAHVRFLDQVHGQTALYGRLKAAQVAVFPSEREGFGIAVLEALACGTPVVTTSAPDNLARHLVTESGGGVVCAPEAGAIADAIEQLLDSASAGSGVDEGWLADYEWDAVARRVAGALS